MRHRSRRRGRAWKLTDPWTQRTRPPILAKPQNGFAQAPTRLINISLFRRTQDQNLSESVVSYPQILRRRQKQYLVAVGSLKIVARSLPLREPLRNCNDSGGAVRGIPRASIRPRRSAA